MVAIPQRGDVDGVPRQRRRSRGTTVTAPTAVLESQETRSNSGRLCYAIFDPLIVVIRSTPDVAREIVVCGINAKVGFVPTGEIVDGKIIFEYIRAQ